MSTRVEHFRQRRRAQGIPDRDPFRAPKFLQRATEMQRLEQLAWPRNQFGEPATIAELMAESAHAGEEADAACSCGCRGEQKQNVSKKKGNPNGGVNPKAAIIRGPRRSAAFPG